jgi:hypothetical protein
MPTEQVKALGTLAERILSAEDRIVGTFDDRIEGTGRIRGFDVRVGRDNQYVEMSQVPGQATILATMEYRVSRIVRNQVDDTDIKKALNGADSREDAVDTVIRRDLTKVVGGRESTFQEALDAAEAPGVIGSGLFYKTEEGEVPDGIRLQVRMPVLEQYTTGDYIRDRDALLQGFKTFWQTLEPELPLDELGGQEDATKVAEQDARTGEKPGDPPRGFQ